VSGLAGFANFKSDAQGMEANTFLLEWTSESHTPINEFELNWRKEDGDWEIFTVPAHRDNSIIWNGKWSFPDLEPATRYEARVLAKNTEGWSRPSPSYHFATFGAEPRTSPGSAPISKSHHRIVTALFVILIAKILYL